MTVVQDLFIGGSYVPASSRERFVDRSPVTAGPWADVAAAGAADASAAVDAAARALPAWSSTGPLERRRVLRAAADLLEQDLDRHRRTIALETGGVRAWADMNVHEAAATLREAASLTTAATGEVLPSVDPATVNLSQRVPAGVVLAVVPWNAPLVLAARATAIALAVGNTVVVRPSEEAPVAAGYLLADALHRAGLPPGVLNVASTSPGDGPPVVRHLLADPRVRRVVFIGSTAVGRRIAAVAGENLVPAVLELGGKNATVVCEDADLEAWVPRLAFASFANSGQVCMATDRIVVHAARFEELTDRLAAFADAMVVGDPREEGTELGPLVNAAAAASVTRLVDDAVAQGATLRSGGRPEGLYARPTVVTGLPRSALLSGQESFGPLVSVQAAADDAAAVELANEGPYGLVASVASADPGRAEALARRIRAGAVHVNGPSVGDEPHVPFGGLGASGYGRLGGAESVRTFTDQRTFYLHGRGPAAP